MRSRAVLLLILTISLGVFAYQQATKPPRYTGGPPPHTPYSPPAPVAEPAPAPPLAVGDPPEAEMQEFEAAISIGQGKRVEARLRELNGQFPGNARLLTFLARLEYGLATNGRAQSRDMAMISFDPAHMQAADEWATQAVAADPELAGAWIVSARVAQARSLLPKSLEMLARAEALDPDSVTLRLQKGDALLAMATYTGDDVHFPPGHQGVRTRPARAGRYLGKVHRPAPIGRHLGGDRQ